MKKLFACGLVAVAALVTVWRGLDDLLGGDCDECRSYRSEENDRQLISH